MVPAPTPLAVGRGTDGFIEGCPDMMTVLKNKWHLRRGHCSSYLARLGC